MMKRILFGIAFASVSLAAFAQPTPEGLWISFDDDGKTPTALIRISKSNGQLIGRIEKVLDTTSEPTCSKCTDDRKNQPLVGLEIIRGSQAAPHNGKWEQGRILDPDDGAEYKLVMELKNGGQVLLVRGYWSVFWRTQQWHRQGP
jgi:uncharacterized protein (DUF2147 family)